MSISGVSLFFRIKPLEISCVQCQGVKWSKRKPKLKCSTTTNVEQQQQPHTFSKTFLQYVFFLFEQKKNDLRKLDDSPGQLSLCSHKKIHTVIKAMLKDIF
jgi:hypothetical protein